MAVTIVPTITAQMDGLSNVASAIAVVSLAVQLVDTVHEISKFLKNVQDAPNEVLRLIETLDQLQGTLDNLRQLIDQQFLVLRLPGSPVFINKAMNNCEKQIKALETFVRAAKRSFKHERRLRRTWASMRAVAKKQDIEDMQCRLRDAKMDLQFALSSNSWQLHMYHIQNTVPIVHQIQEAQSRSTLRSASGQVEDENLSGHEVSSSRSTNNGKYSSPSTKEEHVIWYSGMFGNMTIRKRTKHSQPANAVAKAKTPLVSETAWIFRPTFLGRALQVSYVQSLGYISRSLRVYPMLSSQNSIFRMCRLGDLSGLQTALAEKRVSPFVTDFRGRTLLHHAAQSHRSEVCTWLLQVGLDADSVDHLGLKSLQAARYVLVSNHTVPVKDIVDTYRVLARNQDDVSAHDLSRLILWDSSPPDGVDILISHSSLQYECFVPTDLLDHPPLLAIALRFYTRSFFLNNIPNLKGSGTQALSAQEPRRWNPLIGRLIHKGADLHVPVTRKAYKHYKHYKYPFDVKGYGTPLDVLFELTSTPDEARMLGDEWLGLLASKGHNVVAYLEREMMLHSTQHHITYPCSNEFEQDSPGPRQLHFKLDDAQPCVWWEWWISTTSDIDLLEREFTQMVKHTPIWYERFYLRRWISQWPFTFPPWRDVFDSVGPAWLHETEEERVTREGPGDQLEMRRANRRLEKRYAKSMKVKRVRSRQMPGAWPV